MQAAGKHRLTFRPEVQDLGMLKECELPRVSCKWLVLSIRDSPRYAFFFFLGDEPVSSTSLSDFGFSTLGRFRDGVADAASRFGRATFVALPCCHGSILGMMKLANGEGLK